MSIAEELGKLDDLRQRGVLSFREFQTLKGKLLDLADEACSFSQLSEIKVADAAPELDLDTGNSSQSSDSDTSDEVPQLDADVPDEDLYSDGISDLSEVQVVDKVPELDLSSSSQFEKIEIPEEVPNVDSELSFDLNELGQLEKNELLNKVAELDQQVESLKFQNNVALVDRMWEIEKKGYEIVNEDGHRQMPSKAGSVFVGVAAVAFGIFWIFSTRSFAMLSLGGLAIVCIGVGISIHSYNQAEKYEQAKRRYMRRRTKAKQRR